WRVGVCSIAGDPVGGDAWLGTEQMGIYRSTDNGFTWTQASPPDTNVDPTNGIRDGNIYGITFRPKRQCSFQLAGWHLEILEDLRRIQLDQCSHQQQHRRWQSYGTGCCWRSVLWPQPGSIRFDNRPVLY